MRNSGLPYERSSSDFIHKLVRNLTPRSNSFNIMDLGSGTGNPALGLAQLGYGVDVIEADYKMIEVLNKNSHEMNLDIRIHCQDWTERWPEGKWDIVTCMWNALPYVRYSIKDDADFVSESSNAIEKTFSIVWENLRPGGIFVLETLTKSEFVGEFQTREFTFPPFDYKGGIHQIRWVFKYEPKCKLRRVETVRLVFEERRGNRNICLGKYCTELKTFLIDSRWLMKTAVDAGFEVEVCFPKASDYVTFICRKPR